MQPVFYDPSQSFEKNLEAGPVIAHRPISVPKRHIDHASRFLDFDLNVPFGIPAGPLPTAAFVEAAFMLGFDVVHYKTQRSGVFASNAYPNVLFVDIAGQLTPERAKNPLVGKTTTDKKETEISITNSFGNPSLGPDFWQPDMKKALAAQGKGQLLIASVVGTIKKGFSAEDYYHDFATTAALASETGVQVIEVNLSCPNVAGEGVLCYTPEAVEKILKYCKEKIGNKHLLMKVGFYTKEQQPLLEDVVKRSLPFISGIAAINTIAAPVVDESGKQALPGDGRLLSGICGAGIKEAGLTMVKNLSQIREKMKKDFAIIGVGGVMTPQDFVDYRNAGADVVQSATGAMWNGNLAYEIWKEQSKK